MMIRLYSEPQILYNNDTGKSTCYVTLQGCLKKCKKCPYNDDIHPLYGGIKYSTEAILDKIKKAFNPVYTISFIGGEPFLQVAPVLELCKWAKEYNIRIKLNSGYSREEIEEWADNRKTLLGLVDRLFKCSEEV